ERAYGFILRCSSVFRLLCDRDGTGGTTFTDQSSRNGPGDEGHERGLESTFSPGYEVRWIARRIFVSVQQLGRRRRQLRLHTENTKLHGISWTIDTIRLSRNHWCVRRPHPREGSQRETLCARWRRSIGF